MYRAKHKNTPPLQWDEKLAEKAQAYAEKLLKKTSKKPKMGEVSFF